MNKDAKLEHICDHVIEISSVSSDKNYIWTTRADFENSERSYRIDPITSPGDLTLLSYDILGLTFDKYDMVL